MSDDAPLWRLLLPTHWRALSALYFGCPLYLVGGALRSDDPRDIDLVLVMPDELFVACYADGGAHSPALAAKHVEAWRELHCGAPYKVTRLWERWAVDCAKHNRVLTLIGHRRVDFKTQPESYAATLAEHPRELLAHVAA